MRWATERDRGLARREASGWQPGQLNDPLGFGQHVFVSVRPRRSAVWYGAIPRRAAARTIR